MSDGEQCAHSRHIIAWHLAIRIDIKWKKVMNDDQVSIRGKRDCRRRRTIATIEVDRPTHPIPIFGREKLKNTNTNNNNNKKRNILSLIRVHCATDQALPIDQVDFVIYFKKTRQQQSQ